MDEQFQWTRISVTTAGTLDYEDLMPLLKELHKRHKSVETSVPQLGYEPPAAGLTEIAITFMVLNSTAVPFFKAFFEEWGKISAQALRDALRDLFSKGRESRTGSGRRFIPCLVQLGRVRFYFHDVRSDEDFLEQLHAAQDFVQGLSDDVFAGSAGLGEYGMYWDRENKRWDGSIFGVTEFKGLPPSIWGA